MRALTFLCVASLLAFACASSQSYSLKILLEDEDIRFLNEIGYSICIVRDVIGFDLEAVWHEISPKLLSQVIELTWEEEFYVFHNEVVKEAGDVIRFNTKTQTALQQAWTFDTTFESIKTPVESGSVLVLDRHQSIHTVGLAQVINGQVKALGAIPSSNGISIQLTPKEEIFVFIGRHKESELLDITAVSSPLEVDYIGSTSQTIRFHRQDAKFIPARNRCTSHCGKQSA